MIVREELLIILNGLFQEQNVFGWLDAGRYLLHAHFKIGNCFKCLSAMQRGSINLYALSDFNPLHSNPITKMVIHRTAHYTVLRGTTKVI